MAQLGNHTNTKLDEDLLRHMILNTVRSLKVKFTEEYGELIICCDHKKVWRKDLFPFYKANRKQAREESEIEWNVIFNTLNKIKEEIKNNFSYRVVQIEGAEADDVIGTLVIKNGQLLNNGEKILILSGDKDFVQLQVFGNVTQFDPIRKKYIINDDPLKFTRELILKGDRGDGIPNILSVDNCLISGDRQKPIRLDRFIGMTNPHKELSGDLLRNWVRNETLIDLTFTPQDIQDQIIQEYDSQANKTNEKVLGYLTGFKLKTLTEHLSDF